MASRYLYTKIRAFPCTHLPTAMLMIGYAVFWLELAVPLARRGHTSPLAPAVFLLVVVLVVLARFAQVLESGKTAMTRMNDLSLGWKALLYIGGALCLGILAIGFKAALLPPHLVQESDVMSYHLTLPRQHLIRQSFAHIPWSTADFYLLPLDFALAPFWLATDVPNKFPQYLFVVGLLGVVSGIVRSLKGSFLAQVMVVFALLGSHILGIQIGTAMLDLVICYLFLAALDSLLQGRWVLAAVEAAFLFWSKSFVPLQLLVIGMAFWVIILIGRRTLRPCWAGGCAVAVGMLAQLKRWGLWFLLFSVLVGGPFVAKSLFYTGTPLFPFAVGALSTHPGIETDSPWWAAVVDRAGQCLEVRDEYGSGRSLANFVKHLWLIAVPEKGVNNRYDYPVGLSYLLFVGPFLFIVFRDLRCGRVPVLALVVLLYWATWWLGSQQTRFLYIPLTLMFIVVSRETVFQKQTLVAMLLCALALVAVNLFRAHKADWGQTRFAVLREKDQTLLQRSRQVRDEDQPVVLADFDVAFADFAVDVRGSGSVYVLPAEGPSRESVP